MKTTYREKNLVDFFFSGPPLKSKDIAAVSFVPLGVDAFVRAFSMFELPNVCIRDKSSDITVIQIRRLANLLQDRCDYIQVVL